MRGGGVADLSTLADYFAASATVVGIVAPIQGLNTCVHSRIYAHALYIYMIVYDYDEFHM